MAKTELRQYVESYIKHDFLKMVEDYYPIIYKKSEEHFETFVKLYSELGIQLTPMQKARVVEAVQTLCDAFFDAEREESLEEFKALSLAICDRWPGDYQVSKILEFGKENGIWGSYGYIDMDTQFEYLNGQLECADEEDIDHSLYVYQLYDELKEGLGIIDSEEVS